MSYKGKYSFILKLKYFQKSIDACIRNFSSVGALKHGAYTYETNYESNYGRSIDSLESCIRHFTQMMTHESMDEEGKIPHLYSMATRSLMLLVRYYRDVLKLGVNERIFIQDEFKNFNNIFGVSELLQNMFIEAIWLPPELYISICKCPSLYIQEVIKLTNEKDIIDDKLFYHKLKFFIERVNAYLYSLSKIISIDTYNQSLEHIDIYNDITVPDLLFYDISILIYLLDMKYQKLIYCNFYSFDKLPIDHDKLLEFCNDQEVKVND